MRHHFITYCFASETAPRSIRTSYDSWGQVRYTLERLHLKTKRKHGWSFLAAMMVQDWVECGKRFDATRALQSFQKLSGGGVSIVVFRRPYPRALTRDDSVMREGVFVPLEFRHEFLKSDQHPMSASMSEDDKIAASMSTGLELFKKKGEYLHPADYAYVGVTPVPHEGYVCSGCKQTGEHFRMDCPSGSGGDGDGDGACTGPLDKIRKAYGIPKSMLRRVEDPSAHKNVMKDEDGHFVVRVREDEMAPPPPPPPRRPPPPPPPTQQPLLFEFETVLLRQDEAEAAAAKKRKRKHKHGSTCTHWLRGLCVKGSEGCDFMHDASPEYMPICKFYKEGTCVSDEVCMFRHVTPPRKHTSICNNYVKGFCHLGPRCRQEHMKRRRPVLGDWQQCGLSRGELLFLEQCV